METRKIFLIFSLIAVLVVAIPCGSALAGSGEPPEKVTGGTIAPPEAWAVVVVNIHTNSSYTVAIRAKRVVDCDVQTDVIFLPTTDLGDSGPVNEADFLNLCFTGTGMNLFGGEIPNPIITKIKNFKSQTALNGDQNISFDAQLMNYTP